MVCPDPLSWLWVGKGLDLKLADPSSGSHCHADHHSESLENLKKLLHSTVECCMHFCDLWVFKGTTWMLFVVVVV